MALLAVAKAGGVSLRTVQVWVARAGDERLGRVEGSSAWRSARRAGHSAVGRGGDLGSSEAVADQQRARRVWGRCDSARADRTSLQVPVDDGSFAANDRPYLGQTWRVGWPPASPSPAAAEGLVSAASGSANGRTPQRRPSRRIGHSRRTAGLSVQSDQPAWRSDRQLCETRLDHEFRAEIVGTALANSRPSRGNAVRQWHGVQPRRCFTGRMSTPMPSVASRGCVCNWG